MPGVAIPENVGAARGRIDEAVGGRVEDLTTIEPTQQGATSLFLAFLRFLAQRFCALALRNCDPKSGNEWRTTS